MKPTNSMAAEILEASASGLAAAANSRLERKRAEEAPPRAAWQEHLRQRVLELAAAVRVDRPEIFARRIVWLRRASLARGLDDADVGLALESLAEALEAELPEASRDSVRPALELARGALERDIEPEREALSASNPAGRLGLIYLAACLDAEPDRASALVLGALDGGMPPQRILCDVLLAAQKEVGQLWHVGDVNVAEEHLVTQTTLRTMAVLAARCAPERRRGESVLAASVVGDAHDVGLRVVTDLFALDGWRCLFLGANVPSLDLAQAAQAYEADLVVLTATLASQLGPLASAIAMTRQYAPEARILVGGAALDDAADIWREVGADAFADRVGDVVRLGTELLSRS